MYGGLNEGKLNDLWACDIRSKTNNNLDNYNWRQIHPKGKEPYARFGHSAVHYDRSIYIYGGSINKNPLFPSEGQELLIYNISKIII